MFKKFFLSFFVVGSFIVYSIHLKDEQSRHQVTAPVSLQIPTPTPTQIPTPIPTIQPSSNNKLVPTSTPVPTPTPAPTGAYRDGSYTGSVADAFYGNIQVKAIITGGKITDVVFLQYPSDRSTSIEINIQAMPYLKQEAIVAQSANVDIVSGATDSSIAFRQSLGAALSQAKI